MKNKFLMLILLMSGIFAYCSSTVSAVTFVTYDGIKYSITNGEARVTDFDTALTEAVILDNVDGYRVTKIANSAFKSCTNLVSVTIPNGVTLIDQYAFNGCTSLESISIPDSVAGIEANAFYNCSSLADISIGTGVEHIASSAFDGTAYMADESNWTDGVLYIGDYLIGTKTNTSINGIYTIKNSTRTIADSAFYHCNLLTGVIIPESVVNIGGYAFYGCSLTSVTIPNGVKRIDSSAFSLNKELTQINIPDSVIRLGSYIVDQTAYEENSSNWTDGVLYIGNYLVAADDNITECDVKKGTRAICERAFVSKTKLTRVTIPEGVKYIEGYTFAYCGNLESVTLPKSIIYIGDYAFNDCKKLAGISIPDGVTYIGQSAFAWCEALTSVTVPGSVQSVGSSAFGYCAALKKAVIEDGVPYISYGMFSTCAALTNITFSDSVKFIDEFAFYKSTKLTRIYFDGTPASYKSIRIEGDNQGSFLGAKKTYLKSLRTTLSNGIISVDPINIDAGAAIVVAFYDGDWLIKAHLSFLEEGKTIPPVIANPTCTAKVMALDMTSMAPICDAKIVK